MLVSATAGTTANATERSRRPPSVVAVVHAEIDQRFAIRPPSESVYASAAVRTLNSR